MSQSTHETLGTPQHGVPITHDAMLLPHSVQSQNGDALSIMSEEGSLYGEEVSSRNFDECSPEDPTRNLLCRSPDPPPQAHPKPPPYAEVQLRYLLQVKDILVFLSQFLTHSFFIDIHGSGLSGTQRTNRCCAT